jgi:adenosylcobinamide-GDP ribazoletransferase
MPLAEALDRAIADFAGMVRFYSRLPMPKLSAADDPGLLPDFARATRMLPFAGVVIGLPGALVLLVLGETRLSSLAVAALAVAVTAGITGAFHEDGFADVADGFGGGRNRERRLEIMKDSRIGAFGGLALAIQYVLRTLLLADLLDAVDAPAAVAAFLGIAALARMAPIGLMAATPPARTDGLARAVGAPSLADWAIGLAVAALFFVAGTAFVVPFGNVAAAIAVAGLFLAGLRLLAIRAIGGYTGDVVGAGTILAEIGLFLGLGL